LDKGGHLPLPARRGRVELDSGELSMTQKKESGAPRKAARLGGALLKKGRRGLMVFLGGVEGPVKFKIVEHEHEKS